MLDEMVVGEGCRIGKNCHLKYCIVLDNVVIDNEAIAGCEMDLLFKYKIDEEGICYLTVEDDDDHILLDNKPVSLCYDSADYCPEEDY
mgnify:FL=1